MCNGCTLYYESTGVLQTSARIIIIIKRGLFSVFLSRLSVELRRPLIPTRATGGPVSGHYCAYTMAIGAVFACLGCIPSTIPASHFDLPPP